MLWVDDTFLDAQSDEKSFVSSPAFHSVNHDLLQLYEEWQDSNTQVDYVPYAVWRRAPFEGHTLNIDAEGYRITKNNSERQDALQVWVLGGSTTWGQGVLDDETIPSYLAHLFNNVWHVDAQVRNLGESAYVSTQEVIVLTQELQKGRRPDLVIFYDGMNDGTAAALWPEIPGTHYNLYRLRDDFESDRFFPELVRSTGLYRVGQFILYKIQGSALPGIDTPRSGSLSEIEVKHLGNQAFQAWLENYGIVSALAEHYGFMPLFLFQPVIGVGAKSLQATEEEILNVSMSDPRYRRMIVVIEEMRRTFREYLLDVQNPSNIRDVSDIFHDITETIYYDFPHLNGWGNRLVAEAIFEIIRFQLCEMPPSNISLNAKAQLVSNCV